MTPERLDFLLAEVFRNRRKASLTANYQDVAHFLHVDPITLRRWRTGRRPVPRMVEIIMEIFYAWPEVHIEAVERLIEQRDQSSIS